MIKINENFANSQIDPSVLAPKSDLHPKIWNLRTKKLNDNIKLKLKQIANDFIRGFKYPLNIKDIILTGSTANYNWNQYSDIDLHVLVDFDEIPNEYMQAFKDYFNSKKEVWNKNHNITIMEHEVELYVQDASEPHYSTGVYSVMNDRWITEPQIKKQDINYDDVISRTENFIEQVSKLSQLVSNKDYEKAKTGISNLKNKIKKYRQAGLESGGEYSTENLVFKMLRNQGYLEQLSNLSHQAYDSDMGIEEEILKLQQTISENKKNINVLKEANNSPQTYGDLAKLINNILNREKLKAAGNEAGKLAADQIIGLIPGLSNVKTAFDFVKTMYSANDRQKTNTFLDKINIDDQVSKLLDNGVELEYIKDLLKRLEGQPTQSLQNFNINADLQNWLKIKFANRTVALPAQQKESKSLSSQIEEEIFKFQETLEETQKKGKKDACYYKAKAKYKVWPSAYASGYLVKCRKKKGNIKEEQLEEEIELELDEEIIEELSQQQVDEKKKKSDFSKEKSQGLHGWFARQGGKGKSKGWVDCNTCRKDKETGRKTCKSCGRQKGEKRGKYPACRPTASQCTKTGMKSKKSSKQVSWKSKKEE